MLPIPGNIKGKGLSSPCGLTGVGGRGSGSEQPCNQYVVTVPFPFNSTWPLSSNLKVPNLSKMYFVADDTWIFKAKRKYLIRIEDIK